MFSRKCTRPANKRPFSTSLRIAAERLSEDDFPPLNAIGAVLWVKVVVIDGSQFSLEASLLLICEPLITATVEPLDGRGKQEKSEDTQPYKNPR